MSDQMFNPRRRDDGQPQDPIFFNPPGDFDEFDDDELMTPEEIDAAQTLSGMIQNVVERGGNAVRRWCFANNHRPSEMINEALGFLLASILGSSSSPGQLEMSDETAEQSMADAQAMLADLMPEARADMALAMRQVRQFMMQFDSPEEMFKAFALPDDVDEAEDDEA